MVRQTTSPSKIKAYAAQFGVEFDAQRCGSQYEVNCWSPQGKRWQATGTHFYALEGDGYYTTPDWQKTLNELKATIAFGFENCDDPECDICQAD